MFYANNFVNTHYYGRAPVTIHQNIILINQLQDV
jgi:hypothetical protein